MEGGGWKKRCVFKFGMGICLWQGGHLGRSLRKQWVYYTLCGSNQVASSSPAQGRKENTSCRFLSKSLSSLSAMLMLRLTAGRMERKEGRREEGRRKERWTERKMKGRGGGEGKKHKMAHAPFWPDPASSAQALCLNLLRPVAELARPCLSRCLKFTLI